MSAVLWQMPIQFHQLITTIATNPLVPSTQIPFTLLSEVTIIFIADGETTIILLKVGTTMGYKKKTVY